MAPTGVAAINANGQTIHSFFGFKPTIYLPNDSRLKRDQIYNHLGLTNNKIEILSNMNLLIIDEASMVRCDLLDAIDQVLRVIRLSTQPFGGVKVLLIGDVFQLPPVVKDHDRVILSQHYNSKTFCFFHSKVYETAQCIYLELEKVYRQSEENFLNILDRVRTGKANTQDLNLLNHQVGNPANDEHCIFLTTTNNAVKHYNETEFAKIEAEQITFQADIQGDFPLDAVNVDKEIELKVGAQVMTLRNKYDKKTGDFIFYNGSIGTVTEIDPNSSWVNVRLANNQQIVTVGIEVWENIEYIWNKETKQCDINIKGSFRQIPIKLAWAITVHKSQGLTFDSVKADLSHAFACGQVYVALSRCRKLGGLHLIHSIGVGSILVNYEALNFSNEKTNKNEISQMLNDIKADKLYAESRQALDIGDAELFLKKINEAINIRNDINSEAFNSYLKQKINEYKDFKDATEKLSEYQNNVSYLEELLSAKVKEIEELSNSKLEKDTEIREKTEIIYNLKNETSNLEKRLLVQKYEIERLTKDSSRKDAEIKEKDDYYKKQKDDNNKLKDRIEHWNNMPWWKRIFSKI